MTSPCACLSVEYYRPPVTARFSSSNKPWHPVLRSHRSQTTTLGGDAVNERALLNNNNNLPTAASQLHLTQRRCAIALLRARACVCHFLAAPVRTRVPTCALRHCPTLTRSVNLPPCSNTHKLTAWAGSVKQKGPVMGRNTTL